MTHTKLIEREAHKRWVRNKKVGMPHGKGSTIEVTEIIREFIEKSIIKYNIKSISDAACGDYDWMKLVNKHGASYNGYDINEEMINELDYPDASFHCMDITSEILPKTDLIICRDCLFHLTTEHGVRILDNFKKSGSKYLMSTTFDFVKKNIDLDPQDRSKQYGVRRINIKIEPYSLGKEIDGVYEPEANRFFRLWKLN